MGSTARSSSYPPSDDLEGQALFTWCAVDAVGVPAALARNATVLTICPYCSNQIAITPPRRARAAPGRGLWLPPASCSHLVTQFCPEVNFFLLRSHLEAWRSQRDRGQGRVLSVKEAAELGRRRRASDRRNRSQGRSALAAITPARRVSRALPDWGARSPSDGRGLPLGRRRHRSVPSCLLGCV